MRITESVIELKGLRFHSRHGVLPQERVVGGEYVVDVRVVYDISKAVQTDDVADTINYAELYQIINKEMQTPSRLLEHVAGRIGERFFERYPEAESVEIRLTKCNPPMGADCDGATVELKAKNEKR